MYRCTACGIILPYDEIVFHEEVCEDCLSEWVEEGVGG